MLRLSLGKAHWLQLQVLQYDPHVECLDSPAPADIRGCGPLLQGFPAAEETQVFGNAGQIGVEVKLPLSYADCKKTCRIPMVLKDGFLMMLFQLQWGVRPKST